MKSFLCTLCAALALGCGQAQTQVPQTDLEKMNLKGPVHTVELKSYMGDFSGHKSGHNAEGTNDQYLEFNEAGNLVVKKEFDDSGAVLIHTLEYDAKGLSVKQKWINMWPRPQVQTVWIEIRYNEEGKQTGSHSKSIVTGPDGTDSSESFSEVIYNSGGQMIRVNHSKNGRQESFNEYTYHPNGHMKSNRYFNPILDSEYLTRYDEAGRPVERNLVGHLETGFTYNPNGDIAGIRTGLPPVTFTCTYDYDAHGNWIRQVQIPDSPSYPHRQYTLTRTITYR